MAYLSAGVLAAGGNRPDGFHPVAAAGVDPVVKVHVRIAVRDDELESLAEGRQLAAAFGGRGRRTRRRLWHRPGRASPWPRAICVVVVSRALVPASTVTRSACVALTTVASTVRLGWKSA